MKEIDRSNELLKKFFKFAKPGKPKHEFIDVEMVLESVYLLLAPRLKKRTIELKKAHFSKIPPVYVDENQIEQVFINLFLNAIDAMEKGGTLTLAIATVNRKSDATLGKEREYVEVSIADTGEGIPPERVEKIFNPFYTSKSHGVGLGLSISSRLVEENGGSIEVKSTVGQGSVFKVYLPTT